MNAYDTGDVVELRVTIKDKSGNLVDPSSVIFKLRKPSGTKLTYSYGLNPVVERESLGVYILLYVIDEPHSETRIWKWRVETTGLGAGGENGKFQVRPSEVD